MWFPLAFNPAVGRGGPSPRFSCPVSRYTSSAISLATKQVNPTSVLFSLGKEVNIQLEQWLDWSEAAWSPEPILGKQQELAIRTGWELIVLSAAACCAAGLLVLWTCPSPRNTSCSITIPGKPCLHTDTRPGTLHHCSKLHWSPRLQLHSCLFPEGRAQHS